MLCFCFFIVAQICVLTCEDVTSRQSGSLRGEKKLYVGWEPVRAKPLNAHLHGRIPGLYRWAKVLVCLVFYGETMEVFLNGEAREVDEQCTVAQLVAELGLAGRRLAVEINMEIVPRSTHEEHLLQAGDKVEIVHAIGGGQV